MTVAKVPAMVPTDAPAAAVATRRARAAVLAALLAVSVCAAGPVEAAKRRVAVPHKFDGRWSIQVVTQEGPCDRSYRYGVQIYRGEAIYPGGDVQITGRVSPSGAVSGVIARGQDSARVTGRLTAGGAGNGVWGSVGGLIGCRGVWSASRRG